VSITATVVQQETKKGAYRSGPRYDDRADRRVKLARRIKGHQLLLIDILTIGK
jgi:hypothetical protein